MAIQVQVVPGPEGLEVRKRGTDDDAATVEAEASRLQAAQHPGVVELLWSGPIASGWELRTAHVGPSLEGLGSLAADQPALVASVARTLAELHARGVVHGRLTSARVLVGATGPRLCGFGTVAGEDPKDDVAALGEIVRDVLDAGGDGPDPWWRPPRRRADIAALRATAHEALDAVPGRRPTAARLAAALDAQLRTGASARPGVGRRLAVVVGAAVVGAVILGAAVTAPTPRPSAGSGPIAADRSPSSTTRTTVAARCVARASAPARRSAGCVRDVSVDGGAVVIDGTRIVVGRVGDDLAVGDWDCDGDPTAALLRPATGELLELGPLEAGAVPVAVRAVSVHDARSLEIGGSEDGCPTLRVATAGGDVVEV